MQQESQLTTVSEGSIGGGEVLEVEDKVKEEALDQSEETVALVVRVGENEEDLDYDIASGSLAADNAAGGERRVTSCVVKTVARLVYLRVGVPQARGEMWSEQMRLT